MADVFVCDRCGTELTAPVSRVALPVRAHQLYGHEMLPALMESGTYAVEPEPGGPPWRPWDEVGEEGAAAEGVFAPVYSLSSGPRGAVVVAPGDVRGTVLIPGHDGYCLGLDGRDGPNLACEECGQAVATRMDDCSLWQAVWLHPVAVRRVPGPAPRVIDWETLVAERRSTPPVEQPGFWSPQWEAAAGVALAHLLAASTGAPVALPGGLVTDMFGRALDALLPPGRPARTVALAGPGLPASGADIALVPVHPQTGEAWQPTGSPATVPLPADVWLGLAFPEDHSRLPVTGGLPRGVERDDPLPLRPRWTFRPDRRLFLYTLARLPAVRQPWLRGIYDQVGDHFTFRLF
ncbi:hypothetical protein [Streptomyces diastatochromogenes]|uniref:Uncharacterized protein n=1 Tax=Streptomyces diastatochromogenes TaxID=42236 RepID=A0A233S7B5_STRDA|nr:hypothetical protein [Streptomyces diastatochromogenes]OXY91578.1 hypothetical protein BEK98_30035 [Streptomyces diastatochromogenes]